MDDNARYLLNERALSDSTPAVEAVWQYYAREYSLDVTEIVKSRSYANRDL